MTECWNESAVDRPSFERIRSELVQTLEKSTVDYGYLVSYPIFNADSDSVTETEYSTSYL